MLTCGLTVAALIAVIVIISLTSRFRRVGFGSPCIAQLANCPVTVYREAHE